MSPSRRVYVLRLDDSRQRFKEGDIDDEPLPDHLTACTSSEFMQC